MRCGRKRLSGDMRRTKRGTSGLFLPRKCLLGCGRVRGERSTFAADNEIIIIAVAHHKKRPRYWRNRIAGP